LILISVRGKSLASLPLVSSISHGFDRSLSFQFFGIIPFFPLWSPSFVAAPAQRNDGSALLRRAGLCSPRFFWRQFREQRPAVPFPSQLFSTFNHSAPSFSVLSISAVRRGSRPCALFIHPEMSRISAGRGCYRSVPLFKGCKDPHVPPPPDRGPPFLFYIHFQPIT